MEIFILQTVIGKIIQQKLLIECIFNSNILYKKNKKKINYSIFICF